jgi:hypothetical protein
MKDGASLWMILLDLFFQFSFSFVNEKLYNMTSEKKILSQVFGFWQDCIWMVVMLCIVFFNIYKYSSILQEAMAYDMIIGTTKIVNGNTLTQTYMDKLG